MLVHLSIRDFAIIDALELPLSAGMTVLTGETGAGKSIVVEALTLLLGERASAEVIRTGADEAEVCGQFHLDGAALQSIDELLASWELPRCEDGALLVRRVISRAGRHRQFVNGAITTVAQLKAVAEPLVDFTGQHAHQALLRAGAQLQLLDAYGGHEALREDVRARYDAARAVLDERDRLQAAERDKASRGEYLRYQLDEIRALDPKPGEEEKLAAERARLLNTERLRDAVATAVQSLTEGDDDALTRVQRAAQALSRVSKDDPELLRLSSTLEEASALIDDVARTLSRHGGFDDDPERLQQVDDRLASLRHICRKHGADVAKVLEAADRMDEELRALAGAEERLAELQHELSTSTAALAAACDALGAKRRAVARRLSAAIEDELHELGMGHARIEVRVETAPAAADAPLSQLVGSERRALLPTGSDRVELLLAANAGEEPRPLSKVASGGELSRVLLAVKRVLLARDPVPVSIFDEVDSGVGGAVGEIIGEKLAAISRGRQVLVISHLPQIAARADQHLVVEKHVVDGRTVSRVRALDHAARVEEVARMLGGRAITGVTREHAAEMIGRPPAASVAPALEPPIEPVAAAAKQKKPRATAAGRRGA